MCCYVRRLNCVNTFTDWQQIEFKNVNGDLISWNFVENIYACPVCHMSWMTLILLISIFLSLLYVYVWKGVHPAPSSIVNSSQQRSHLDVKTCCFIFYSMILTHFIWFWWKGDPSPPAWPAESCYISEPSVRHARSRNIVWWGRRRLMIKSEDICFLCHTFFTILVVNTECL